MTKPSKIKILVKKMRGKTDSFFYPTPQEVIAEGVRKDGTVCQMISNGEIRVNIDGTEYSNCQVPDAVERHKLTDKKLQSLNETERMVWRDNNWFEVIFLEKGSDQWDCVMGEVAYDYEGGLQLLKDYFTKVEVMKSG